MLWIIAFASGVKVSLFELLGMRFRLIPPEKIVYPMIKAVKAGLDVDILQLETHYLSGGNVARVVDALIVAKRMGLSLVLNKQQPWVRCSHPCCVVSPGMMIVRSETGRSSRRSGPGAPSPVPGPLLSCPGYVRVQRFW